MSNFTKTCKILNSRAKEIQKKHYAELMGFTYNFYGKNMSWLHRKTVSVLFYWKLYWLSGFIQSFAAFSIKNHCTVPPKIDIYSLGSWRMGVAHFFYRKKPRFLAGIFSFPKYPHLIEHDKKLIASNYRDVPE